MPHLTLEYTCNLAGFDAPAVLARANAAMFASGLFGESDIKSRAIRVEDFLVGIESAPRAFVHARIALLPGRTGEQRRFLADAVLDALREAVGTPAGLHTQLSVETLELDRGSYARMAVHG